MRTPCEWTISEFIPRVRSSLVKELNRTYGKNQKEIASLLGISQPRVSQYINETRIKITRPLDNLPMNLVEKQLEDAINRTANSILTELIQGSSPASTIPIICASCRELRTGSALCTLHMYDYKELGNFIGNEKNCDLCLKWKSAPKESSHSIEHIESRIDTILSLETLADSLLIKLSFLDYVPQIGAQICMFNVGSKEEHLRNVAGYPGRIIKYLDQAKVVSKPEYYASKTTASFLLDLRKNFQTISTVLCIKNQKIEFLNLDDFSKFQTDEGDKTGFINQIESKMKNKKMKSKTKIAVLDSGSIGYEPIAYIFVSNPSDLSKIFD